jgi:hypothetical protein
VIKEADMKNAWFAVEHHRLHVIEDWPDGPHKEAALEAVRSSLVRWSGLSGADLPICVICAERRRHSNLAVLSPHLVQIDPRSDERAA